MTTPGRGSKGERLDVKHNVQYSASMSADTTGTKASEHRMNLSIEVLHTKILVNHFVKLCGNFSRPYKVKSVIVNRTKANSNTKIIQFLSQVQRLINDNRCDAETFRKEILKIKNINILHLEILWYLDVCEFLSLKDIIHHHQVNNHNEVLQHISQNLFDTLLDYQTYPTTIKEQMLTDYLKAVFYLTENDSELFCENQTMNQMLLNLFISNFKRSFKENSSEAVLGKNLDILRLIELFDKSEINKSLIKLFFGKIICSLFIGSSQTLKAVFQKQEIIKSTIRKTKIYGFLTMMSKYFNCTDLLTLVQTNISEIAKMVNWDIMFPFITFIGVNYKDGWSMLKIWSNSLLKESFQNYDDKLLSFVFLIARQGCFERPNTYFPSYLQWFSSTFSSESKRPINSKEICKFFFDFLTELTEYDSSYYSKVHINRTPWVPVEGHSYLTDYVTLVKTHLCDLNQSVELGICENSTNKSAAVFDVENVINHFEKTSNILSSVFQASMFSKNYYEKKFLVELLSKYEGKNSVRHKLILKLHSFGKIPESMFKKYKNIQKNSKRN